MACTLARVVRRRETRSPPSVGAFAGRDPGVYAPWRSRTTPAPLYHPEGMSTRFNRVQVVSIASVIAGAVFITDLITPVGVAHAILYLPAVVVTVLSTQREDPFYVAGLCTSLALLAVVIHPVEGGDPHHFEVNTVLAVLAIWMTAVGVRMSLQAESELKGSGAELGAILDTLVDGVVTMDTSGTIISANPAAASLFGYTTDEMRGMDVTRLMPSPHAERHEGYVRRFLETGERRIIGIGREVVGLRKNGSAIPIDLGVSVWDHGETMFTAILRDLSDRRRMEAEVRQVQKLDAIGRLTSGIAHDFNNLLMGVISCGKVAKSSGDPAEVKRQVDEILGAAERGTALTRQLLTFGRRRGLAPEPAVVDEVIEGLEPMLSRLLGDHVEMGLELGAGRGRVLIDPGQVEQVLMNLAINSRDAIPDRGRLTIKTRIETCSAHGVGHVGGVGVGDYVALEVTDDGTGMDEETRSRAFDPFFTSKDPTKGTGLGLSTVYGITQQCGGHLHLLSEIGQGTTVTIHLPVTESEPAPRLADTPPPAPAPVERKPTPAATILVVEDDRLVRAGVRHLLEELGYEVLLASSGPEALRVCGEHPGRIDVLLTDILMPGMTGGELAREVAARFPSVRRVYMSALPNETLVEEGRIEAGEPSLVKPFSEEDVAAMIAEVLA